MTALDGREVVRVVLDDEQATVELKDGDTTRTCPLPLDAKLRKRMAERRTQFFYATRKDDGSIKLEAYAPWQDW